MGGRSWINVADAQSETITTTHPDGHPADIECSDKGVCDGKSGECACFDGYEGIACQRTVCPENCNGHGTCQSLADIAVATSPSRPTRVPGMATSTSDASATQDSAAPTAPSSSAPLAMMSWVARAARTAVTAPAVASATTPVASASASPALSAHVASRRRRSSKARLNIPYSSRDRLCNVPRAGLLPIV